MLLVSLNVRFLNISGISEMDPIEYDVADNNDDEEAGGLIAIIELPSIPVQHKDDELGEKLWITLKKKEKILELQLKIKRMEQELDVQCSISSSYEAKFRPSDIDGLLCEFTGDDFYSLRKWV